MKWKIHTYSIQDDVFLYIPIYREYYPLPCHDFKANIQDEKKMKKAKGITRRNILMVNKSERLVSIGILVKQCVYCLSFVFNHCGIKTS